MKLQLKRSAVLDSGSAKEPTAAQVEYGELCVNYNEGDPALFIKNSLDQIIRIAGAGAVGDGETPGGPVLPDTGNKPGDVFFNTTNNSLYYWNGSEWVPIASQENAADIYVGTFDEVDAAIAVDDRANGLLLWETTEGQLYIWYIDADTKQWVQTVPANGGGGGGSSVSVMPTAPTVANQGDLWYCTSDGRLYVYYDDNATSQWVDASPDDVAPVVHSGEIWPSDATEDDLFFNTTDGRLYIYYNDGDSIQWVDASPDTQNYTNHWERDGAINTLSPATAGDNVAIDGNVNIDGTLTISESVVKVWSPLEDKVAYEDYQGALYTSGPKSDWSFANDQVTQTTYSSNYLYLGNGYIVPSDYAETITWIATIPGGSFGLELEASNDRITWTQIVNSSNGANSYTFTPGTQPVALRFKFRNSNGTQTDLKLSALRFPNMRSNHLVEQGSGGGGVVESSDWVDTTGGNHMYIRYADGTQICQYRNLGTQQAAPLVWVFPKRFVDLPGVSYGGCRTYQGGTGEGNGVVIPTGNSNVSETQVSVSFYKLSGYGDRFRYFGITAIGRWK